MMHQPSRRPLLYLFLGCSLTVVLTVFFTSEIGSVAQSPQPKRSEESEGLIQKVKDLEERNKILGKVIEDLQKSHRQLLPLLGAVIAWHRDIKDGSKLGLPPGWIECNGQEITEGPL